MSFIENIFGGSSKKENSVEWEELDGTINPDKVDSDLEEEIKSTENPSY